VNDNLQSIYVGNMQPYRLVRAQTRLESTIARRVGSSVPGRKMHRDPLVQRV